MANEMQVELTATLTADPEERRAGEKRVLSIRLAHNARIKRRDEYSESAPTYFDGSLWERWPGDPRVQNVLDSLRKGDRVEVRGRSYADTYKTRDGREGTKNVLEIDKISPSLEWASAAPVKNERGGGQRSAGDGQAQGQAGWASTPAAAAQSAGNAWGGAGFDDQEPF